MITKARYCDGETFADFMARPVANHDMWAAITKHLVIPIELSARVDALGGRWHLLVLSEDWCGDSVNIIPIIAKLTESVRNMDMRILKRDENLDIMDAHLTEGKSRSIPIVIVLNDKYQECGWWGPRPSPLQKWVVEVGLTLPKEERYKEVRKFYARDHGLTTMHEIVEKLEKCCVQRPAGAPAKAAAY